jgi:hypothetical protein
MVSLPIPDSDAPISYSDIGIPDISMGDLVSQLTKGRIPAHYRAHLDPDLLSTNRPRLAGWKPLFGQTGAAQGHLHKNVVRPGDLFLFFGLFQAVKLVNGKFIRVKEIRPSHVIWGWFQIGEILTLGDSGPNGYEWAAEHPHFYGDRGANNTLYIARQYMALDGIDSEKIAGAGVFSHFSTERCLTAASAQNPSTWDLPVWFYPEGQRPALTYHANPERWRINGARTELKSAARGQEFILDCDEYPEAIPWVAHLLASRNIP